ncbi:HIT family protein [Micromonospora sp. DT229]|uniref:HIT family protein n=1 Tax=Micromonospora sp. DT229 TaxID=3393430 RepID=UPI003CF943B5
MDVTNFTEPDLARLSLSTRLRDISEICRIAVAADEGEHGDAERLWALLAAEVPLVQEAIVHQVRARGGSWADVARTAAISEEEARERWEKVELQRVDDPVSQAKALDDWYIRHAQLEPLAQVRDPFSRLLSAHSPIEHECLICVKYKGGTLPAYGGYTTPPGGYLVEDGIFRVGHGPTPYWPTGTLLIESYRHFLDFAEMNAEEVAAIGPLIASLIGPLKEATGASRIHVFACMEGAEHFHTWLVPRVGEAPSGRAFIANPGYCTVPEAEAAMARLRTALARREAAR